jgi:ribA/ribD-fused uncharacterized protein
MSITPATPTAPPQAEAITSFKATHNFLSNFWFVAQGIAYDQMTGPTVEHVFQAAKTLDPDERRAVLTARMPLDARRMGRTVTLRPDWEHMKLGVMAALIGSKFSDRRLAALLLATDDAKLVEGNHWCDTFWGVCDCRKHDNVGENWLGRILMIQRSFLRA